MNDEFIIELNDLVKTSMDYKNQEGSYEYNAGSDDSSWLFATHLKDILDKHGLWEFIQ